MASPQASSNGNRPTFSLYDSTPLYYRRDEIRVVKIQASQYHEPIHSRVHKGHSETLEVPQSKNGEGYESGFDNNEMTQEISNHESPCEHELHHCHQTMNDYIDPAVRELAPFIAGDASKRKHQH